MRALERVSGGQRYRKPGWEGGKHGMVAVVVVSRMKYLGSSQRVRGKLFLYCFTSSTVFLPLHHFKQS